MNIDNLRIIVAEVLEIEPELLTMDAKFDQLTDFDSMMMISLMVVLDENGVSIEQNEVDQIKTFGDIVFLAQKKLAKKED
ncbi:MAG TPA: phosphopantetheine-binding protein [Smithellaceae bacterium]|nr:phosphopantetheine-binding protein [Smithellaceae bacterium]